MPIVELHLLEGYPPEDKARLGAALTDAVRLVVPARPEAITVMTHEMRPDNYMRGGVSRQGAAPLGDPEQIVRSFLSAMERRDLPAATAHLGPGFRMQFPGTAPLYHLSELIAWAGPRYKFVTKTFEGFDVAMGARGAVVYCRGTLAGEWPDGTPFGGIRFIDRFELEGDLIIQQDVWNDIAETKANTP